MTLSVAFHDTARNKYYTLMTCTYLGTFVIIQRLFVKSGALELSTPGSIWQEHFVCNGLWLPAFPLHPIIWPCRPKVTNRSYSRDPRPGNPGPKPGYFPLPFRLRYARLPLLPTKNCYRKALPPNAGFRPSRPALFAFA
jgi:hypothetical protein